MTHGLHAESTSSSRRALLAGVFGGIGAWAAGAFGRPSSLLAANGGNVILGQNNGATAQTSITNSVGPAFGAYSYTDGTAVLGSSASGRGVYGTSNTGTAVYAFGGAGYGVHAISAESAAVRAECTSADGVYADSTHGTGVVGQSIAGMGVYGQTDATNFPGVMGVSFGNNSGVVGASGYAVSGKPETGVYGVATQGTNGKGVFGESFNGKGVFGESPNGRGVQGKTTTGYAGYFEGKVYTTAFFELNQIAAPAAPGTNRARLFLDDTGSTQRLRIRFGNGVIKTIATDA